MQITDRDIIDWLLGIGAAVGALFMALYWYIWRGDRERINSLEKAHSALEVRVANSVTKPEAEHLFELAKESYHAEHGKILEQTAYLRGELASLRGELISILRQPWRGEERRRK